jgi:hypothetical protein
VYIGQRGCRVGCCGPCGRRAESVLSLGHCPRAVSAGARASVSNQRVQEHQCRIQPSMRSFVLCAFALVISVEGHFSMIMPPPRNAIDSETPAWSNNQHPMTGTIEPYNCRCTNGTDQCNSGQSCFWFR